MQNTSEKRTRSCSRSTTIAIQLWIWWVLTQLCTDQSMATNVPLHAGMDSHCLQLFTVQVQLSKDDPSHAGVLRSVNSRYMDLMADTFWVLPTVAVVSPHLHHTLPFTSIAQHPLTSIPHHTLIAIARSPHAALLPMLSAHHLPFNTSSPSRACH